MAFKSATQPYCRWCAKPIRKNSILHFVRLASERRGGDRMGGYAHHYVAAPIFTIADCQRLVNETVTAIRKNRYGEQPNAVSQFYTWDGESYQDECFCSNSCAIALGYAATRTPHFIVSKEYNARMASLPKPAR